MSPAAKRPSHVTPPSESGGARGTILLVEDDRASRDATRELLVLTGYHVAAVSSKKSAVHWCKCSADAPSLILSDYLLPENATGLDVILWVREHFGEAVPAVLITGLVDADIATQAHTHGCELLRKPVSSSDLLARIDVAIR
ncbi:MAG: response regulator [Gammaproteobacteria bacterium]|nr:response regulator [Gammaproteobacteria bacterium]